MIAEDVNSPEDAAIVAEKILDLIRRPFMIQDKTITVTCSIGVTLYPDDIKGDAFSDNMLSHADQAMENLKYKGGDGFCFFTNEMQKNAERRILLKNNLLKAIRNKTLSIAYQPIFNLKTGELTKFEALLRWNLKGQWIPPIEFIQLAEEFSLIIDIGQQVLEKVCQLLNDWKELGLPSVRIAVNRSIKEWPTESHITPRWLEILDRYNISPSLIEFEITESILAPENQTHIEYLNTLKKAGAKIALDDFGTGYSSLSYLRRFSADVLKIDQSFISQIHLNQEDKVLVSTVLAMARSLNIEVVAEGVENEEQLAILSHLECDYIQGFLLSIPLNKEDATDFLTNFSKQNNQYLQTYKHGGT